MLSLDSEGTRVAEWLNSKGIAAFVLKYRLRQQQPGSTNAPGPPPAGRYASPGVDDREGKRESGA